jgi:Flp pilus assembly protein TadD
MQQAIALNKNKDSYYFELGALLERTGEYENAVQNMKRTIELNPTHSNAHNFLGYMYATQGKSLDEALDHLQTALSIQPKNGYFYDSLGWIYYKRGEPERALEELKKAMVYTPPDPVVYSHLGDIYFSLKSYSKADQAWRNALALTLEKMEDAKGEIPDPQDLEKKIHKAQGFLDRN